MSHSLRDNEGVTWCMRCGAFTSRWPRALLRQCPRRPRTAAQANVLRRFMEGKANVLRRLMEGKPPTTAAYLAKVATLEGRPADVVAHKAEVEWRAQAWRPDHGGNSDETAQMKCETADGRSKTFRSTVGALPLAGCYLRLRGGPLFRPPARSSSEQPADKSCAPSATGSPTAPPHQDKRYDADQKVVVPANRGEQETVFSGSYEGNVLRRSATADCRESSGHRPTICAHEVLQNLTDRAFVVSEVGKSAGRWKSSSRSCDGGTSSRWRATSHAAEWPSMTQPAADSQPVRRRLRGKQRLVYGSVEAATAEEDESKKQARCSDKSHTSLCTLVSGTPWAGRVTCDGEAQREKCSGCKVSMTRIRCRGCQNPICLECAKHRVNCHSSLG